MMCMSLPEWYRKQAERYIEAVWCGCLTISELHAETVRQRQAEYKLMRIRNGIREVTPPTFDDLSEGVAREHHKVLQYTELPVQHTRDDLSWQSDTHSRAQMQQSERFGVANFASKRPSILSKRVK